MARMTEDEQIAALEKQKEDIRKKGLALNRKIRGLRSRQRSQADRDRSHIGIVVGLGMIEHAIRNPGSEVRRVARRIVLAHLEKRPDDRPKFGDLLALWDEPRPTSEAAE